MQMYTFMWKTIKRKKRFGKTKTFFQTNSLYNLFIDKLSIIELTTIGFTATTY
jgi:hypothetical protein